MWKAVDLGVCLLGEERNAGPGVKLFQCGRIRNETPKWSASAVRSIQMELTEITLLKVSTMERSLKISTPPIISPFSCRVSAVVILIDTSPPSLLIVTVG